MAKMQRTNVSVLDKTTNKTTSVLAEQTPRRTEAGVHIYLKINQTGMEYLQTKKGLTEATVSTEALRKWFCELTGMPAEGIGSMGNLKDPNANARWVIKVGDVVTFPANAAAQPVLAPEPVATPQVVGAVPDAIPTQPQVVAQPTVQLCPTAPLVQPVVAPVQTAPVTAPLPLASAPVPPIVEKEVLDKIGSFKKKGYSDEKILMSLSTKIGADKATELMAKANAPTVVEAELEF